MRSTAIYINDLWNTGGPFIGTLGQPHSRVTVQGPWPDLTGDHKYDVLRTTYDVGVGTYAHKGVPLRWFQSVDNDQVEIEVPNVKTLTTSRSIDQDAATFDIVIYNQKMFDNNAAPDDGEEAGQPGYYTFSRGASIDSIGRWGQTANDWANLLVPNALLRTYQGYGGTDKTLQDAIDDGNIILTGVWLVDHAEIHTDGLIHLTGRDMAKLLIDQQLYMPLIPKTQYPLTYYRFQNFNQPVHATTKTVVSTTQSQIPSGERVCNYETSEVDAWYDGVYGHDMSLHGHHPSEAFDGNTDTYYLGVGNSRADAAFAVAYLQATCGETVNAVYIHPWAGNYTCYVSIMERGVWQGADTIPYDPTELYGTQPTVVDTGANIPYVMSFGVPWETPTQVVLPRVYQADRVRISFRDLTYTEFGPWHYRAGVREFRLRATGTATQSSSSTNVQQPFFETADAHPSSGYLTADMWRQLDAFGDARLEPLDAGPAVTQDEVWCVRFTPTGLGYYVLTRLGHISSYGDAVRYGDPATDGFTTAGFGGDPEHLYGCTDMALTSTGAGYWVLDRTGTIWSYGDAAIYTVVTPTNHGDGTSFCVSMDSTPPGTAQGVWVLDANGTVFNRGAATYYGSVSPYYNTTLHTPASLRKEGANRIRRTSAGDGYWIATRAGRVKVFGSATDYGGSVAAFDPSYFTHTTGLIPHPDNSGYLLMRADGHITDYGISPQTWDYGSPIPGGQAQLRKDGNYLDYSDIIKDLALWAGFTFYDSGLASNETPSVYGNIESTGAFSYETLPPDIFDKHPVIDAMHALKEVVGYLLWVDDEGAFRFESPNWWAPGNFDETGTHITTLPVVDEAITLINYSATVADDPLRSLIIISSEDPDATGATTVTTRLIPATKKLLRGLVKPAMWINGYFLAPEEQKLMAELIALHVNFQSRVGQVTCAANPAIQINDQVRIFERQTADTYIHYVRGVDTTHDLDSGSYTMTLTTHWLGDENDWAIQAQGEFTSTNDTDETPSWRYLISPKLIDFLRFQTLSPAAHAFGGTLQPANTMVVEGSQTGTGAAEGLTNAVTGPRILFTGSPNVPASGAYTLSYEAWDFPDYGIPTIFELNIPCDPDNGFSFDIPAPGTDWSDVPFAFINSASPSGGSSGTSAHFTGTVTIGDMATWWGGYTETLINGSRYDIYGSVGYHDGVPQDDFSAWIVYYA